jgi:DHA1 family bicyclomycin/chloramphenicol resistance-like MFS transporter
MRSNSKVFLLVLLGMLTAFGPFVTDMYLPSLPSMTTYFHTNVSMVQLGLTLSMVGLAVGQLLFGPISDRAGRRPPLIAAMILFIVSTIACIFSVNIIMFISLRLLQGIAGAGGIVISRSIATDKYDGRELMKMLALIGAVNGIAPIAAPVIGGAVLSGSNDWREVFVVLLVIGALLLGGSFLLKESLPPARRSKESMLKTFELFYVVVKNKKFMLYVLQQGFAQFILFGNIASSPFIIQQHYGFSEFGFGILFAINSVSIGASAVLSMKFRHAENSVKTSCTGMVIMSLLEAVVLFGDGNFWLYESILFVMLFMMGFTFTASTTLALDSERKNAETASAMLGAICFLSGGIISPLVGIGNMLHTTAIIFMIGAGLSSVCAYLAMRGWKESYVKPTEM